MSQNVVLVLFSYAMIPVALLTLAVLRRAAGQPALPLPQWWLRIPVALQWAAYAAVVFLMLKVAWNFALVDAGEYGTDPAALRLLLGILDVAAWLTLAAAGLTAWRRSAPTTHDSGDVVSLDEHESAVPDPTPRSSDEPAELDRTRLTDRPRPGLIIWTVVPTFALTFAIVWFIASRFDSLPLPLLLAVQAVALLFGAGFMLWNYINVDYALSANALLVRQGGRRREIPVTDIVGIEHGRGFGEFPVESYANRALRRLVIHVTEGLRVVITPTNPEEMRDEILRRRDAARSNSR